MSHALSQEAEATKPPNPKPLDSQAQSMTLHGQGVSNFEQKKNFKATHQIKRKGKTFHAFSYSSLL